MLRKVAVRMKGHEAQKGTERDGTWHLLSKRQVGVMVVIMVVVIVVVTAAVAVVMVLCQMRLLGAPFPFASLAVPSHSSLLLPDHLSASSYWLGSGVWAQCSVHLLFSPCTHTFTFLLILPSVMVLKARTPDACIHHCNAVSPRDI